MPEIKCWNGATLTTVANYTVVDQCYCSTSTNAQSGVAVAQIAALRNSTICIATPTSTAIADSTLLLSGANGSNPASLASYPATSISTYVWSKINGCTIANATCFAGCTYACAKADIRNYTPTAVSGTVTLTAPTAVGKSTCITSAATTDGFDIYGCWRSADNYDLILNLRDDGTNYVGFACNGTVKSYICASNGYFYGSVCGNLCGTATNATCFAGCTYAQACSNIRSGLTSCTGTVTSVNVSVNGVSGTAVTGSGTVTLSNVPPYFANNTLYTVGDDVKIGDVNVAGKLGIQGANADTPGFVLRNCSGTVLGCLYATGSTLCWTGCICAATAVCTPTICGTTAVCAPTICGTTAVCAPTGYVSSLRSTNNNIQIGFCTGSASANVHYGIVIGSGVAGGYYSTIIGYRACAMGDCTTAIGFCAFADSVGSLAIGHCARAVLACSIAIGSKACTTCCNAAVFIVKDIRFDIMRTIAVKWAGSAPECDVFNAIYCRLNLSSTCFTTSSTRHIMVRGVYAEHPLSTIRWDCAESPLNIDMRDFGTTRKTIRNACTGTMGGAGFMEITYISR